MLLLNYVWSNFTWEFYVTTMYPVEPLTHAPSVRSNAKMCIHMRNILNVLLVRWPDVTRKATGYIHPPHGWIYGGHILNNAIISSPNTSKPYSRRGDKVATGWPGWSALQNASKIDSVFTMGPATFLQTHKIWDQQMFTLSACNIFEICAA
jgi:hypothetical protein